MFQRALRSGVVQSRRVVWRKAHQAVAVQKMEKDPTPPGHIREAPTMLGSEYNRYSVGQLSSHAIVHEALRGAVARVAQLPHVQNGSVVRVSDLGCSSGANALSTA